MLGLIILGIALLPWVVREHILANKYRELIRLHNAMKLQGTDKDKFNKWKVTYKDGRATKDVLIEAPTESAALAAAIKVIRYDKILSVTR